MTEPQYERRRHRRGKLHAFGDLLYGSLRWVAGHVRGFWAALITFLSVAFVLAVAMVVTFGVLAENVMEGDTTALDNAFLRWVGGQHSEMMNHVMLELTALGNLAVLVVVVGSVSIFLWLSKHKYSVALLLMGGAGGFMANNILKLIFDRDRPSVFAPATDALTNSFPSGHAMMATIVYGSVAYLVGRLEPTRAMRIVTWTLATLIILLVAFSRMYLGMHYPTDVIGGIIAGVAWIGVIAAGLHAVRYFAERDPETGPEVEQQEHDLHAEDERAVGARE